MAKKAVWISGRALAEKIQCDEKAVRKARDAKLLDDCYDYGTKKYNWTAAESNGWVVKQMMNLPQQGVSAVKAAEKMSKNQEKKPVGKNGKKNITTENVSPQQETEQPIVITDDVDELDALIKELKIDKDLKIDKAILYKQILSAALDKVELMKERKTLVKVADVNKALYAFGAQLRKALEGLPARIIDDIRAAPNKVDAMNIFSHAQKEILKNFSEAKALENI